MSNWRYALRSLRRAPALTATAVLALGLGIGATTAVFSLVDAVLLRPLPYPHPDRLVRILGGSSYPDVADWMAGVEGLEAGGGFRAQFFDLTSGAEPERIDGALVSGRLFDVLGARAHVGRLIQHGDDTPRGERVIVISHGLWQRVLGGRDDVVGQTMTFASASYRIVGVLERGFALPQTTAHVFAPVQVEAPQEAAARGAHTLVALARLPAGGTRLQAQAELDALAARLERQYPRENTGVRFVLAPLHDAIVGRVRPVLLLIGGAVAFVLLIACANVANLLIARAVDRRGEMAVRTALGASSGHLTRQLLTEGLLLSSAGAAAGLVFAWWITRAIVAAAPTELPRLDHIALDLRVLLFTIAIALATGLVFGLAPLATLRRASLLASASSTTRGPSRQRLRSALVVAEVALTLMLTIGAGLLLNSFYRLTHVDPGFQTKRLLTFNLTLRQPPRARVPAPQAVADAVTAIQRRTLFFDQVVERLERIPGVTAVAASSDLPIAEGFTFHNLAFEGRDAAPGTEPEVYFRGVNGRYFDALGAPVVRGRAFTAADRGDTQPVAVVNEAFVASYYPGEDPIGRRIRWASGTGEWITIVGVAPDVKGLQLDAPEVPAVYVPYAQDRMPWRAWMDFAVRTDGDPHARLNEIRQAVAALDRTLPLTRVATMETLLARSIADRRFNLLVIGAFASVALVLAGVGLYGVMAYTVRMRTREIGVRMALGAQRRDVTRLIVAQAGGLMVAGLALGLAGALATNRLLDGLLFGISSTDAATFAAVSAFLLALGLAASFIPARRAAGIDPLRALRE